jgi:hypothetical protein
MLWLLYCLPLLFKVWQSSDSCCCGYIFYQYCLRFDLEVFHVVVVILFYLYCLRFDREVVHDVVVILSTITVYGLTEEWFMLLLLYCLPLLFMVWQRRGSCGRCYIFYQYCLRFDREVFHVEVVIVCIITVYGLTEEWFILWLLYCLPLLFMVWQRSGSCCCYIFYHYCLRFDRGVVHVVVVIFSTITV